MSDDDPGRAGFYCTNNDWMRKHGAGLGPYGIAVYHALMSFADKDGVCWPSYQTIADITGMSRKQAQREVAKLIELGILTKQTRDIDGKLTSNLYEISRDTQSPSRDTQSPVLGTHSPVLGTHSPSNNNQEQELIEQEPENNHQYAALPDDLPLPPQPNEETHSDLSPRYSKSIAEQLFQSEIGRLLRPGDKRKLEAMSERATTEQIARAMARTKLAAEEGTRINDAVAYCSAILDSIVKENSDSQQTFRRPMSKVDMSMAAVDEAFEIMARHGVYPQ